MSQPATLSPQATPTSTRVAVSTRAQIYAAIAVGVALVILFIRPLVALVGFSIHSQLYSHVPLIPVITGWLIWIDRREVRFAQPRHFVLGSLMGCLAIALVAFGSMTPAGGDAVAPEDALAPIAAAFVVSVWSVALTLLDSAAWRKLAIPFGFLVFLIPLPSAWLGAVENVLQHGSAAVARFLFQMSGTSVFYQDLTFHLPGIHLLVAPECSGIRSTLALLMVSLVGGHIFLRRASSAALLTACVLPVALLRNGLRIFTVGELCVAGGPSMIDHPLHRNGGPLFFAVSMIPFVAILWVLIRRERTVPTPPSS